MEKYDIKFKKKFGQNFLKNDLIIDNIIDIVDIDDNSLVIEVGPGGGILTKKLSEKAKYVIAYEIDDSLNNELNKRIGNCNNIEIIYKDFLESDIAIDIGDFEYSNIFFVSNVPYYITTPIIYKLINSNIKFKKIVMMVQKEVGDRLCASPGSKNYGSISVFLNYYFDSKIEFFVSRNNFVPIPNVDSVVISFLDKNREKISNYSYFEQLVYDSFRFKRKNLKNNLKNYDLEKIASVLVKYNLNLSSRAEELSVDVFIDLSNALCK